MARHFRFASLAAIVVPGVLAAGVFTSTASADPIVFTPGSGAIPLSSLLGTGNSIQVGDKIFDNFTYTTSGADMPAAADVNITPEIITVNSTTMYGFNMSGGFQDTNSAGNSIGNLGYSVHVTDPAQFLITSASLLGDPDVVGTGQVQVTESWTPEFGPAQIRVYDIEPGNSTKLEDTITFPSQTASVTVTKQIVADIGDGTTGSAASITSIDQLYAQTPPGGGGIPEPASLGILALGAVGLMVRRRRSV
jgi:hypothetical protein